MGIIKVAGKVSKIVWILVLAAVLYGLMGEPFYGSYAVWTKRARALFNPDASVESLPEEVRMTMDGHKATFQKGSADYDRLLSFLRSEYAVTPSPVTRWTGSDLVHRSYCGRLTIPCGGIPFHFDIYRSNSKKNYLIVIVTKLTSPGSTAFPVLEDGRFLRFVQEVEKRSQGHEVR